MPPIRVSVKSSLLTRDEAVLTERSFVLRDTVIFYDPTLSAGDNAGAIAAFKTALTKISFTGGPLDIGIFSDALSATPSWLIKNSAIYNAAVAYSENKSIEDLNFQGIYFNEVIYNNDHLPDDIPPIIKREGSSRFWANVQPPQGYNPGNFNGVGIGIGVIDFGFYDPHGAFIRQIIHNNISGDCSREVRTVDYNLAYPEPYLASIFSLCQQIEKGVEEGIHILNISLGYYNKKNIPNPTLESTITEANKSVIIVCSAGNAKIDLDKHWHWPSNFSSKLICVGSDKTINFWKFSWRCRTNYSNYGSHVHLYENGAHNVDATAFANFPPYQDLLYNNEITHSQLQNDTVHGTSFSSAYVSARIGLDLCLRKRRREDIVAFMKDSSRNKFIIDGLKSNRRS